MRDELIRTKKNHEYKNPEEEIGHAFVVDNVARQTGASVASGAGAHGGSSICENAGRSQCEDCGSSSICEHQRERSS